LNADQLILRNSIRCNWCGQEIVSSHRHDFRYCTCGRSAVDGGDAYLRRLGDAWTETSVIAIREQNDDAGLAETAELLGRKRSGLPWQPRLDAAPTLEAWRIVDGRLPSKRMLVGVVTGHPDFADGTLLATTGLVAIDGGWARTTRRFYRLGGRQQ
jgi:hypothetical protein